MYSNCGSLEDAFMMFNCMSMKNAVTWSAMIGACVQHEVGEEALELLSEMESQGIIPRKVTLISSLAACSSLANESIGFYTHNCIMNSGYETDTVVGTALVDMYGKCGNLVHAEYIFKNMENKNILSWTAMIGVYAMHGDRNQTLSLFDKMLSEGMLPDQISFLCILSACNHLGLVDESCIVFGYMIHEHGIGPTVEHYNCVIDLLSRIGRLDEGEMFMNDMPFEANNSTLLSLLAACRMHFDMERAERTAGRAIKLDPQNPAPYLLLGKA